MGRGTGFAAILALVAGTIAFTGCGDESPSQAELRKARQEGAQAARLRELERELRAQERSQRSQSPGSPSGQAGVVASPSGGTSCGDGLSVGPNTSCPFAKNVRAAFPGSDASFDVYSPVTGETYSMRCTTASPHVCTGGNNASVYFP